MDGSIDPHNKLSVYWRSIDMKVGGGIKASANMWVVLVDDDDPSNSEAARHVNKVAKKKELVASKKKGGVGGGIMPLSVTHRAAPPLQGTVTMTRAQKSE